jgi:chromosomal replication initiator protein DnaA
MRIALDDFDERPSEATDGMTLLREVYASHPDIIVLHRELPDQDGLEVIGRLKEDLQIQRPPVVVVTNGRDPDARLACFAADADDVMSVPFDARELKARVEAVLRRGRGRVPSVKNPFATRHLSALAGNVFDTFVEGRSNRAAVEAARAVADKPGARFNPLFLYGPPGVGKTHLLSAIGHYINSIAPDKVVLYVPASDYSNEFLGAVATGEMELFRSKYSSIAILLLDDIQYLGGGESLLRESGKLFRTLAEQGKQVVTSSDRALSDLAPSIGDVAQVLEKGLVAKIDLPDRDHRYQILQTQCMIHKWNLSEGILGMIADLVASDVRALQGAARKLIALRAIQGGVITVERARDALADLAQGEEVIEEAAFRASTSIRGREVSNGMYELAPDSDQDQG